MEEKSISIKCPKCHNTIGIRNHSDSNTFNIRCPFCQEELTIKLKPHPIKLGNVPNFNTQPKQPSSQQPKTQPYTQPRPQPSQQPEYHSDKTVDIDDLPTGNPELVMFGQKYILRAGCNTVGRKSDTSTSTLQLPVADKHMSRTNASINVSKNASGRWHTTINSCNERNLVKINDHSLEMGDTASLRPGDVITMGQTKMMFMYE